MELISIIVPVHNVEQYLPACIDSIVNQTYRNIEIILVDDGSTDNSGKICDEYAAKDNRILVIHKNNAGVSLARIDGFDACHGVLVMFVDSDDYVSYDIVEKMYNDLMKFDVDMVSCQVYEVVDGAINETIVRPRVGFYDKEDIIGLLQTRFLYDREIKMAGITGYLWSRLIKSTYIRECLQCGLGMIHSEDQVGVMNLLYNIKSMYVQKEYLYYYVQHDNQTTKSHNSFFWNNFEIYFKRIVQMDEKNYLKEQLQLRALMMLKMLIKMELSNNQHNVFYRVMNIRNQFSNIMFSMINDIKTDTFSTKEKLQYFLIKHRMFFCYSLFMYINYIRKRFVE